MKAGDGDIYPGGSVGCESVESPVVRVDVEESGDDDEYPDDEVDGIEDVVKSHGSTDASRQDTSHRKTYDKPNEVRIRLTYQHIDRC